MKTNSGPLRFSFSDFLTVFYLSLCVVRVVALIKRLSYPAQRDNHMWRNGDRREKVKKDGKTMSNGICKDRKREKMKESLSVCVCV